MATVSQVSLDLAFVKVQAGLAHGVQPRSGIFSALDLPRILQAPSPTTSAPHQAGSLYPQLNPRLSDTEPQPSLTEADAEKVSVLSGFSVEEVTRGIGMCLISYVAMGLFSTFSFYINGAVGAGKVILSLPLAVFSTKEDFKTAQSLFEEGAFQVLVAIEDVAIAHFSLIRGALAIAYGIAPKQTNEIFEKFFKWRGPITHVSGASSEQIAKDRENHSATQRLADAAQCFFMPDDGQGRLQSAWAALRGVPFAAAGA